MVIESINLNDNIGEFAKIASAFNKFVTYENRAIECIDIESLQMSAIDDLTTLLNQYLQNYNCLKFELIVDATLTHPINQDVTSRRCFHSIMHSILLGDDIQNTLITAFAEIKELVDQHTERGSGWTLNSIKSLQINIGKYVPHRGGCSQFSLPIEMINKKCLINIKTQDSCFLYSVLAALHPFTKNAQRKSNYTAYIDRYDITDLPLDGNVDLFQAVKFAKRNNFNINIYTYDIDEKCVIPLKIMGGQKDDPILLFLYDDHYYKITHFDRFASCKNKHSRRHCYRCLSAFTTTEALQKHKVDCFNAKPQRTIMPDPHNNSSKLSFYLYQNEIMHPYVVYADFETLSVANADEYRVRTLPVCSYGYVAIDWTGKIIAKDFYRGEKSGEKFLASIVETKRKLDADLAARSKPLNMTDEDEFNFRKAKKCFICSNPLHANRVRDHDHLTGKYRGAAHNECNLIYRLPSKLPVFFHNLKNFDSHIIFRALSEPLATDIFIIPHTMEKYIAFTFKDFIFLDSYAFLPSSLETLAENVTEDYKSTFLKQMFDGDVDLLMKKAALPYEYIDSFDRFKETSLPEIDKYYSSLKDANISNEMYNHLQNIWNKFACETLGDFHDLYLKVDVILLAAVFENFRKVSHENFNLDPCHNFSIPGLSMNAALRYTRAKAGLLTDVDMLIFVEKGIRGGLTVVSKRYCKTRQGINEIIYLDVNNLYGYAMSQPLPYDNFQWVELKNQNIDQLLAMCRGDTGMIFEVDLIYPDHLHDEHNDFPLAPYKMEVTEEMHSQYQKELLKRLKERKMKPSSSEKLLSTFYPREKYVVHHKLLKYYISKGLIVTKVHRAFKFREKAWLQPYVDFCTKQRQAATNSFTKDFWKLGVNSIYGKTIEDKRKHRRVQLVFKESIALKRLRSELCESFTVIGEDKMLFQLKKGAVYMNKPVSVGFVVLELAKLKMFELHYDHFKARLGNNVELLYTDTDSLIYNIKTNEGSTVLKEFSDIMDFSNYPKDHPLYNNKNEKAIGFIKDEMGGKRIEEFIALKPKLYALKTAEGEKKKAKGIQKNTVNKTITFKQYEECLWDEIIPIANQKRLQSKDHVINMIENKKIVMTPFDDKRYLLEDAVSTLAYGHFATKESL
uniref:DNA-directed DNA polymerase n=1 Tax=Tetranychus urticae TaxID=32264 RepID=A0A158P4I1_TETUR